MLNFTVLVLAMLVYQFISDQNKSYSRSTKNINRQIETPVSPTRLNTSHEKKCLSRHINLFL